MRCPLAKYFNTLILSVFPPSPNPTNQRLLPTTRETVGAIFGEKCVRVVDAVPTCAHTAHPSAWFQGVVHLPDLDDRVWDARLVDSHGGPEGASSDPTTGDMEGLEGDKQLRCQEEERKQEARRRGRRAGMGLLAVALAHNSVEVSLVCRKHRMHVGFLSAALPPPHQRGVSSWAAGHCWDSVVSGMSEPAVGIFHLSSSAIYTHVAVYHCLPSGMGLGQSSSPVPNTPNARW